MYLTPPLLRAGGPDAELRDPVEHAALTAARAVGSIRGPIVGVEAMTGVRIDDDLRRLVDRALHPRDEIQRDAPILPAVETEYRRLQVTGDVDRPLRLVVAMVAVVAAVPGDPSFETIGVCGVEPNRATAPAEAGDADLAVVDTAVRDGPVDTDVEIRHRRCIGRRVDDRADLGEIGEDRGITRSHKRLRRHGHESLFRDPSTDVANVLVKSEEHQDNQNQRQLST